MRTSAAFLACLYTQHPFFWCGGRGSAPGVPNRSTSWVTVWLCKGVQHALGNDRERSTSDGGRGVHPVRVLAGRSSNRHRGEMTEPGATLYERQNQILQNPAIEAKTVYLCVFAYD